MNLLAQSDQLEIRFYYDYYDRAWENGYASRIPEIENLSVTVRRACRVLYHKELYEQ